MTIYVIERRLSYRGWELAGMLSGKPFGYGTRESAEKSKRFFITVGQSSHQSYRVREVEVKDMGAYEMRGESIDGRMAS